ncbi:MAG: exopolysaccharide biosynthesis polyprenyl glycosylphosphotransferase [Candidatus Marinimicrobia bacterium]|nr:exopolysaccharide biosynthesis polyprenyl glycosylphosphotransferase [Candidatus Neomarinimicrobiota bacterium]MCF7850179.1 exopolysaccharide biosynthesis polyprenyl glycosylphosphotransferase [Candidatus Neomarinimicrobiota bacterium]MCF7905205.1 exopolysaccharide biosynthesis polyprenyl glycosylphosphotransferase [Candidatus Neomarinimicrobiota bacterium]
MHSKYNFIFQPLFLALDLVLLVLLYQFASHAWLPGVEKHHIPIELIPISWIGVTFVFFFYSDRRNKGRKWHLRQISIGYLFFFGIMLLIIVTGKYDISRGAFFLFLLTGWLSVLGTTIIRWTLLATIRKKGFNTRFLTFVGNSSEIDEYKMWVSHHPELGYNRTNYLTISNDQNEKKVIKDVHKSVNTSPTDEIAIGSFHHAFPLLNSLIDIAEEFGARVRLIERPSEKVYRTQSLENFGPFLVQNIRQEPLNNLFARISKRIIDTLISIIVLTTFFWWFYLLAGLLIKISSRGPIVFRQKRVGRDGNHFTCFKFRTMKMNGGDPAGDGQITKKDDKRITWIGQILRKSNLDELPQFYNVLKGEMSVIGPRPHMVDEDEAVSKLLSKYKIRRFVKPGITGWAAVNGYRGGTDNMDLMQERVNHDIYYIENWSPWLDTKIFFLTIWQMLTFTTKAY